MNSKFSASNEYILYVNQLTIRSRLLVLFVGLDDLLSTFLIVQRIQNLIEPGIALFLIQEIDELFNVDAIRFALCAKWFVYKRIAD